MLGTDSVMLGYVSFWWDLLFWSGGSQTVVRDTPRATAWATLKISQEDFLFSSLGKFQF